MFSCDSINKVDVVENFEIVGLKNYKPNIHLFCNLNPDDKDIKIVLQNEVIMNNTNKAPITSAVVHIVHNNDSIQIPFSSNLDDVSEYVISRDRFPIKKGETYTITVKYEDKYLYGSTTIPTEKVVLTNAKSTYFEKTNERDFTLDTDVVLHKPKGFTNKVLVYGLINNSPCDFQKMNEQKKVELISLHLTDYYAIDKGSIEVFTCDIHFFNYNKEASELEINSKKLNSKNIYSNVTGGKGYVGSYLLEKKNTFFKDAFQKYIISIEQFLNKNLQIKIDGNDAQINISYAINRQQYRVDLRILKDNNLYAFYGNYTIEKEHNELFLIIKLKGYGIIENGNLKLLKSNPIGTDLFKVPMSEFKNNYPIKNFL
ncbi:DUF4249 family protein [Flammeovirga kamogawensis]|nr:DUF4249 family protein [Flammeovirga kamogawensis]